VKRATVSHRSGALPGAPKEPSMYGTIRRYKIRNPKEFTDKVNESFINVVRTIPGFVSYMAIDEGDGWWASVSVFATREAAAQSGAVAAKWVKEHADKLVWGPPEVSAGPVVVK
jgi:hypothetical protein